MELNSQSTLTQIQAVYDDCASYDLDGSVEKARNFVVACRLLLGRTVKRVRSGSQSGGFETERDPAQLQRQMDEARLWLRTKDAALRIGGVRHYDMRNFRE